MEARRLPWQPTLASNRWGHRSPHRFSGPCPTRCARLCPNISASNYQQVDSDRISREVLVDRDAAEVVYVSVDKKTNQVINQFPEESRLRARAYLRAQDTAKLEVRKIETDRRA